MYEYEHIRRVSMDMGDDFGTLSMIPVCPTCGRFVKVHETMSFRTNAYTGQYEFTEPNATCQRCGPVMMLSEGFI